MANTNTIAIELVVNDNGSVTIKQFGDTAESSLKKVQTASGGLDKGMALTWAGITAGAAAAVIAVQKMADTVAGSIKAYMDSESALMKLGMAMKNQGDYSAEALAELTSYADQIQQTTAYEDDLAIAVMGNLKSYGMLNQEVMRATQVAMDFASAKANEGMTITQASELIGKAYMGQTEMLGRYGIVLDENIPRTEKFEAVLRQLSQRFGGAAQAELSTYAGQWKQLQNQWNSVQEFLGLVFLKTIQLINASIGMWGATFLTAGNAVLGVMRMLVSPLMVLLDGLGALARVAGMTGVADGINAVTSAIGNAQANIVATRASVFDWAMENYRLVLSTDQVTNALDGMNVAGQRTQPAVEAMKQSFAGLGKAMKDAGAERLKFAGDDFSEKLKQEGATVAEMAAGLGNYLTTLKQVYSERIEGEKKIAEIMEKSGAKPADVAKQLLEAAKLEKEHQAARLEGWKQYYDSLAASHTKAQDQMKAKTQELAQAEAAAAQQRRGALDMQIALQQKLLEAQGKAANSVEVYNLKLAAAEKLYAEAANKSGAERVQILEQYKAKIAELSGAVVEYSTKRDIWTGKEIESQKTIISQEDAIKAALEKTNAAQKLIEEEQDLITAAKKKEKEAVTEWETVLARAMAAAKSDMDIYRGKVDDLSKGISQMDTDVALTVNASQAEAVISRIRTMLSSIPDETVNLYINTGVGGSRGSSGAYSVSSRGGGSSISSNPNLTPGGGDGSGGGNDDYYITPSPVSGGGSAPAIYYPEGPDGTPTIANEPVASRSQISNTQVVNFTWKGNIEANDKPPEQLARELARPLKKELERLNVIAA